MGKKGDVPTAVSPDGKKFTITGPDSYDFDGLRGCDIDKWEDEDGHRYFELGLTCAIGSDAWENEE